MGIWARLVNWWKNPPIPTGERLPPPLCPKCHNPMATWRTYATGKRECVLCATRGK